MGLTQYAQIFPDEQAAFDQLGAAAAQPGG
jgi:hypothetical protein